MTNASLLQGGFKRPVGFDDAVTGQRFTRPLKQLPSKWILELVFMLARRLVPSIHIGCPESPYILSPLISTAQVIFHSILRKSHFWWCSNATSLDVLVFPLSRPTPIQHFMLRIADDATAQR